MIDYNTYKSVKNIVANQKKVKQHAKIKEEIRKIKFISEGKKLILLEIFLDEKRYSFTLQDLNQFTYEESSRVIRELSYNGVIDKVYSIKCNNTSCQRHKILLSEKRFKSLVEFYSTKLKNNKESKTATKETTLLKCSKCDKTIKIDGLRNLYKITEVECYTINRPMDFFSTS